MVTDFSELNSSTQSLSECYIQSENSTESEDTAMAWQARSGANKGENCSVKAVDDIARSVAALTVGCYAVREVEVKDGVWFNT
jgi:hypothetical protein